MLRLVSSTALLLAATLAVHAPAAEVKVRDVEVGFGGVYEAGEWTPIAVHLSAAPKSLAPILIETVTADPTGAAVVRRNVAGPLGPPGTAVVGTVFQSGRVGSDLTVRLRAEDGSLLAERYYRGGVAPLRRALPKEAALWVTAGMTGVDGAPIESLPSPAEVTAARIGDVLPADPLALSAADLLIVRGDLAVTAAQAEAIHEWVAGGGHLVVALGRHTQAFRSGPFASWVPVEVVGEFRLFDLERIEAYSRSNRRPPRSRGVTAARLDGAAETLLSDTVGESETRLIVRSPYGFGRVTLFAFDLDAAPFVAWEGLPAVLARALLESEPPAPRAGRTDDPGLTDLSTQLMRAEEASFGIERPTTGRALLLLLAYAAIVGPLDYLVVHRVLRRPALTWVTLPLLVLGAAWWLEFSAAATGGNASRVAQVDLVDLDAAGGTVRGRTALTLYSSASTRADVAVRAGEGWHSDAQPVPRLAWAAPPEDTFGGTYREGNGGFFRPEYFFPPPEGAAEAKRLPMLVGGSRSLTATWRRNGAAGWVDSQLVDRGRGILEGPITHSLPGPLTEVVIAFGDRLYAPRERGFEWHPGDRLELDSPAIRREDLDSFLTGAKTKQIDRKPGDGGDSYVVTTGDYDPNGSDLGYLVRMLTFHRVAGGRAYTGLSNVSRPGDDLTPLLRLGRAVLVGRLDRPATAVEVEAADGPPVEPVEPATFVRIVLAPTPASIETPSLLRPDEAAASTQEARPPLASRSSPSDSEPASSP